MKVAVLGSGSRGNAVAVKSGVTTILLDAGFAARTLERRLASAGFGPGRPAAIVLTHEHGDHARGAASLARRAGCAVYASAGTLDALAGQLEGVPTVRIVPHSAITVGPFTITACRTSHDAAEPLAFAIHGPAPGQRLGLAYDLGRPTAALRYLLRGAAGLIVEANHDEVMLRTGRYPAGVRQRIAGMGGHLSNRAAAELLAELCHTELQRVVLAHVSELCNRPDLASAAVHRALALRGFAGQLHVASQDAVLPAFELAPSPAVC